jgi:hypothetical protein
MTRYAKTLPSGKQRSSPSNARRHTGRKRTVADDGSVCDCRRAAAVVLLDLGCGKGRVLYAAAMANAGKSIHELAESARANAQRFRGPRRPDPKRLARLSGEDLVGACTRCRAGK